jgi:hypothetical protein
VIFPDEWVWWRRGSAFVPLSCSSFDAIGLPQFPYPTLYGYVTGALTALATALGAMHPPTQVLLPDLAVVGIARGVAAAAGVASAVATAVLGARLSSRAVGLAAAALLAVAPLDAWQVHYASVDPLLSLLSVAVCLPCLAWLRRGGWRPAFAAGALAGLAFATKYTGVLALAPVGYAVLERAWQERSLRTALQGLVAAGAGFALAFAAACPPCVYDAPAMLGAMRWVNYVVWSTDTFPGARLAPSVGWYARPYLYQLVAALPYGLGWPLYALALAGVGLALWRRDAADRLLLAALLPGFLVIGAAPLAFARYLLPLFPALALLAARAALALRWPRARVALLGATWLYSFLLSFSQIAGFSLDQQREVAGWIASRARDVRTPPRVAIPVEMIGYDALAPFLEARGLEVVRVRQGRWWWKGPDYFVLPERLAALYLRSDPESAIAQEVLRLRAGETGYRAVASFPDRYPQRTLYAWLDPGLHPALGAYGYTVYQREREPRIRRP